MKKTIVSVIFTSLALASTCAAAQTGDVLSIDSERLTVDWHATVAKDSIGANDAMYLTPMLACGADTVWLEPVVFRSRLNQKVTERRRKFKDEAEATCPEHLTGEEAAVTATLLRLDYPELWAGEVRLMVSREVSGCCTTRELPPLFLAATKYVEPFVPMLAEVPDFPYRDSVLQIIDNEPDADNALDYLRRSAAAGNAEAQTNLDQLLQQ